MCVCASIRPGSTVAPRKSITSAPAGILTWDSGPTSVILSPLISTTCFASICPVLLSNRRPARTAVTWGAGGHFRTPPSDPTHGTGPAPRHGAGGGRTWAESADAVNNIPNAAVIANVDRIEKFSFKLTRNPFIVHAGDNGGNPRMAGLPRQARKQLWQIFKHHEMGLFGDEVPRAIRWGLNDMFRHRDIHPLQLRHPHPGLP